MTDQAETGKPLVSNGSSTDLTMEKKKKEASDGEVGMMEETRCGVFSWRPSWLMPCSNMKAFTAVLSFLSVFGSMNYSYYTAVITQIEKAYGLSSSMTGFIKNIDNIGFMATVLLVSHFCRYSNMPRLFAGATVLSSVAIFIFALPHFIYGGKSTSDFNASSTTVNVTKKNMYDYEYCEAETYLGNSTEGECTSSNRILDLNTGLWPCLLSPSYFREWRNLRKWLSASPIWTTMPRKTLQNTLVGIIYR